MQTRPPQTQPFSDALDASEVITALRRIRRDLTDTQRVVYDEVLDTEPAPSASRLSTKRGVSRQRISKLRLGLRRRVEDSTGAALDGLAAAVAVYLGDAVEAANTDK